jgi:hypothetical protein
MIGSPPAQNDDDVLKQTLARHGGDLGRAIGVLFVELQNRIKGRVEALETRRRK